MRLNVSDRAARRYVSILREAGVHIDSSRGRHGGYRLGRSLRPPPLMLHGRWYLLCLAHEADAARAYRIDRINHVDILNTDFEPPADLNPVAWLETHLGSGWKYTTCVEFAAPFEAVAPHMAAPMGHLEPSSDGDRCILRGTTNNPTMYASEWLAAIPYPSTSSTDPNSGMPSPKSAIVSSQL